MNKQIFLNAQEVDLFSTLTEAEKIESKLKAELSMLVVRARCDLGMNQAQFAKHLAVSQATISKWENGNCNLTVKSLSEVLAKIRFSESSVLDQLLRVENTHKQNKSTWGAGGFPPSLRPLQQSSPNSRYTTQQGII